MVAQHPQHERQRRIGFALRDQRPLQAALASATGEFLASAAALKPLDQRLRALDAEAGKAQGVAQLKVPLEGMAQLSLDLDLLSNLLAGLPIEDAQQRTQVVETISELYARLNQARARAAFDKNPALPARM